MKLRLFSIKDRLMNVYLTPFPARADVEALRQVAASFSDPSMKQTPVAQSPQDYDLVFLGEFDDETGVLVSAPAPVLLKNLRDIAAPEAASVQLPS